MKCNRCGCNLEAIDKYCPECGSKVEQVTQQIPKSNIPPSHHYQQTQGYQPDNRPAKKNILPGILAAVGVLILICVAGILLFTRLGGKKTDSAQQQIPSIEKEVQEAEGTESQPAAEEKEDDQPLTASVKMGAEADVSAYKVIKVKEDQVDGQSNISSKKYDKNNPYSYEGFKAMDGDSVTSWQFDQVPSTLKVSLKDESKIHAISFKLGNWREDKEKGKSFRYNQNCRPKQIKISMATAGSEKDLSFSVNFQDERKEQVLMFNKGVAAKDLSFEIISYYKGNETKDVCVSEIVLYEE